MISLLLASLLVTSVELDLQWSGPSSCPDQFDVELRVADLVGRSITMGPEAAWSARADVRLASKTYVTNLRIDSVLGTESRTLHAPDCEALADAVAVIVALALDSGPVGGPPQPAPDLPTVKTATTARLPSRVVYPRRSSAGPTVSGPTWGLQAIIEASTHLGLADPGVGTSAQLGVRMGRWSVGAGGTFRRSGLATVAPQQAVQAEGWAGLVRGCRSFGLQTRFAVALCLSSELGRLRLSARGRAAGEATVWWAQTTIEPTFSARLQPGLRGFVRTQLLLALARPRGDVIIGGEVLRAFRVPRWAGGLAIGLQADF